jgi:hypothetical protein
VELLADGVIVLQGKGGSLEEGGDPLDLPAAGGEWFAGLLVGSPGHGMVLPAEWISEYSMGVRL